MSTSVLDRVSGATSAPLVEDEWIVVKPLPQSPRSARRDTTFSFEPDDVVRPIRLVTLEEDPEVW